MTEKRKGKRLGNKEIKGPYFRNVLLHLCVKEDVKKDTDNLDIQLIQDEFKLELNIDYLDRAHRIGSSKNLNAKPRSIIVKLAPHNAKPKVFSNKKTESQKYQYH